MIDPGETAVVEGLLRVAPWEHGKGVAGLLQRFCSRLVKRQYPGVKVVRLTRDNQSGPRELKKYRLITKQVRRTRGLGWPNLSAGASRRRSPGPACHWFSFSDVSTGASALEPCPGTPCPARLLRGSHTAPDSPAVKPSVLPRGRLKRPGVELL